VLSQAKPPLNALRSAPAVAYGPPLKLIEHQGGEGAHFGANESDRDCDLSRLKLRQRLARTDGQAGSDSNHLIGLASRAGAGPSIS